MFARKVTEQVAMAYFHIVAVENAKGATILVIIKSGLTVLKAAIIELACIGIVQVDAVPATATHVEEVKTSGIGYSKEDGIVFRA